MNHTLTTAKEALKQYALTCITIDFIGQSANTIYKITDQADNSYSLRLHQSRSETLDSCWTEPAALRSEMVWLQALARETDLVLPVPVANIGGEFLTVADGITCTLVRWVEGEQKPFIMQLEDTGFIGEMIGKLHRQASGWCIPEGFRRPSFDGSSIRQSLKKLKEPAIAGLLDAGDAELLQLAGWRVIQMMDSLERTLGNWGMIHADLIPSNFVFHKQEARPIDFGACGFGYFLSDLGWTFSYIHPAYREYLLQAYAEYYPLPDNYVELLEGFFIAGQLGTMHFWLGLPDFRGWLPDHIRKLADREFKAYVHKEPFLFGGVPYWE